MSNKKKEKRPSKILSDEEWRERVYDYLKKGSKENPSEFETYVLIGLARMDERTAKLDEKTAKLVGRTAKLDEKTAKLVGRTKHMEKIPYLMGYMSAITTLLVALIIILIRTI